MSKSIIAVAAAFALSACAGGAAITGTKVATVLSTPAATSLVASVQNMSGPVGNVVTKINAGVAAALPDVQMACAGMAYANALFQVVAAAQLVPAQDAATESAAMTGVNSICDDPPTDIGSAVSTVAQAYLNTISALKTAGVQTTPVIALTTGAAAAPGVVAP